MTSGTSEMVLPDLLRHCQLLARNSKSASRVLAATTGSAKNEWLRRSAAALEARTDEILAANAQDCADALSHGLNSAAIDRLQLNPQRLAAIARSLHEVAALPDPVGEVISALRRPNGLDVAQLRVPLGVIFMIYESRPNVTVDAAALCIKSGNAVILRGGKEAFRSNHAFGRILSDELVVVGLPEDSLQLLATTNRDAVRYLLELPEQIDLAIPRGGSGLIRRVVAEAQMPVLKHYDGICHIYVDESAQHDMAVAIILDSKVSKPGVCNAVETLLIHASIAPILLPKLAQELERFAVEVRGDEQTCRILPTARPADLADWDTEYLDLIVSIRIVPDLDAALQHIARHGSKHTEAIITNAVDHARRFVREVDAAAVVVNASTRFNDGGQLGLGAEIGISTDKIHARGPCGLRELTSTQWVIQGSGQIRG